MTDTSSLPPRADQPAIAAIIVLLVLTIMMVVAMMTETPPHPPLEVAPFALGPFFAASLAVGAAALFLIARGGRYGTAVVLLFAVTALVSFGPQKYFDPAFLRIWPAVITAQAAITVLIGWCIAARWPRRR